MKNKSVLHFLLPLFILQQSFRVESWWWNFTCNWETSEFGLNVVITLLHPFFFNICSCGICIVLLILFFTCLKQWPQRKQVIRADTRWDWWLFIFKELVCFTPRRTEFSLWLDLLVTYLELGYFIVFSGTCHLMKLEGIYHFLFLSWNSWRICEYFYWCFSSIENWFLDEVMTSFSV